MYSERMVKDVLVLDLKGQFKGGAETQELDEKLTEISGRKVPYLLLNLAQTQHLNSTALGALISAHSQAVRNGRKMALCGVDKRIENIFLITKLSLVFDVYPTEEQALAAFAMEASSGGSDARTHGQ
jgi:anti-sigma B factor antagonist